MKKSLFSIAVIASLFFWGCGNSEEKKQYDGAVPHDTSNGVSAMSNDSLHGEQASLMYICPCGGCPEVKESKPGKCPKCEMELVEEKK